MSYAYFYNGLGERTNGGDGYYVFGQPGQLLGEYDVDGNVIEETVYLGNQPVVVLTRKTNVANSQTGATEIYYLYADHLNTPRVLARASDDQIAWRWDNTEPFGALPPDENPSGLGPFVYNQRFPGQVLDRVTGFYYNYFRDYDPQTGRYVLQSDPIGLDGGINTYSYGGGNPVSNVDPMGLQSWPGDAGPSRRPSIPGPFDILTPGTQANNECVGAVNRIRKVTYFSQK